MTKISSYLPELVAEAASDKKARDILILDVDGISSVTDFFIICSANSSIQVKAIADNIEEKLAKHGFHSLSREGYREGRWILLDYGACVAHIFIEEDRVFYNLEQLWGDAEVHSFKG
ncbi:hypothetical protein P22_3599 [Propionispora sp. 2/2-37]|uniref:ribosome silencing factor n=1 Tax=Propionispora sp. 2/2-37 TaxID=1677858 RepID=UPI0006BB6710|nr:ribosome silencing factor [Propionispora sp. 2/2-37]CUH97469.1 hypothetical protein P22_3599 [Propionispora sp. 2/2-37]